jgi:TonB family protein
MKTLGFVLWLAVANFFPDISFDWAASSSWPGGDVGSAVVQQEERPPVDMQAVDVEPKLIKAGTPVYPKEAAKAGLEGMVWVKVWVTAKGEPKEVEVLKSENPVFNKSALDAAKEYRFTPAEIKGKPVAVWVTIPFKFKLADKKEPAKK